MRTQEYFARRLVCCFDIVDDALWPQQTRDEQEPGREGSRALA
jgi:hypothetical protein